MKIRANIERKAALYEAIERGELGLPEALRSLRRSIGKTQAEYAALVKLSPRILKEIERSRGNPTLKSIRKALNPFGLDITVCRRNRTEQKR